MGKKPQKRRLFTPEFKAEIVDLCQRGDRSIGQIAKDSDLTEHSALGYRAPAGYEAATRQNDHQAVA